MTTQIKRRRGTTTQHSTFAGAEAELTVDTDKNTVVVHDGSTAGGFPLAKESGSTLTNVDINSGTIDGVTIGATTPAEVTGTTITGSTLVSTGNITVSGTVDGRDVAADGTKLDGIEAGATADQTAGEIKTAYESNADTNAFTDAEQTKLSGIEAGADVTDTANVTAAGALMDSELTNEAAVKALNQGVATTDSPTFAATTINGNITVTGTVDGRDVAADGTKLDGIEAGADVTDTANVTAAGALMDSELTNITAVKALDQGVATTDSPDFAALNVNGTVTADGLTSNKNVNSTTIPTARSDYQFSIEVDGAHTGDYVGGIAFGDQVLSTAQAAILVADRGASAATGLSIATGNAVAITQRMRIDDIGDISFYEDTGTTPKMVWSASAESLVIGASSTATVFEATGSKNDQWAGKFTNTNSGGFGVLAITAGSTANEKAFEVRKNTSDTAMLIDGLGNVGIGTSSPARDLHINGTAANSKAFVRLSHDGLASTGLDVGYSSGGYASIYNAENTAMTFSTNATERMRIDASGRLLVGKTAPNVATDGFEVHNNDYIGVTRDGGATAFFNRRTSAGDIVEFRKDNTTVGSIGTFNGDFYFGQGAAAIIANSGTPNILPYSVTSGGYSDNAIDLGQSNIRFKDLYLSGVANAAGFQSNQSTTGFGYVNFGDTDDSNIGQIGYDHSSNYMRFQVNNAERMRIDASGNLLVGKTSSVSTSVGSEIRDGAVGYTATFTGNDASNSVLSVMRNSGDGEFLLLRNSSGATVGTIGLSGGTAYVGGYQNAGIYFNGTTDIRPWNTSTRANLDNSINLGSSSARFKDLYLSGGVYLGGTGAANKLDDYEEGTWTPSLTGSSGAVSSFGFVSRDGHYRKVGDTVIVWWDMQQTNISGGSGSIQIPLSALPFVPNFSLGGAREIATGSAQTYNVPWPHDGTIGTRLEPSEGIQFQISRNNGTWGTISTADAAGSGKYWAGHLIYRTSSN